MKALSVRQPHAAQLANGTKPIEFRSWRTHYRGDLLIVSGVTTDVGAKSDQPRGVAICIVELYDVTGEPGDYEWHVRNPRPVENVPVKGVLKLFEVPDEMVRPLARGVRCTA